MSRGLTDTPEPEESSEQLKEMDQAIEELFSMVSVLYSKIDTLEKIIGHSVMEKRVKGL